MKIKTALTTLIAMAFILSLSACKKNEASSSNSAGPAAGSTTITWMGYTEGMKKAAETHKPVMVDFYTTWCKYCKMLDETTYKDPEIVKIVNNDFIAIKVNAEGETSVEDKGKTMTERDLAAEFKVSGFPTIWFFDQTGKPIAPLPGYSPPEDFKPVLTFITSGSYAKGEKFEDYVKSQKK